MDIERWQRLSPLLDALLELPVQLRNEHLAALRREDAPLADELEKLLSLEEGDADFLTEPVVDGATATVISDLRCGPGCVIGGGEAFERGADGSWVAVRQIGAQWQS